MSMKAEFDAATSTDSKPKTIQIDDIKSKLQDLEDVASKITAKHATEIKMARETLGAIVVNDFVKDLVQILTNFKLAIPVYKEHFDWLLIRINSYSVDKNKSGGIQQKIVEFHELISAKDRKKRLKKHDFTVFGEIYTKEKALAKTLQGIDLDLVLGGLPTASKKNVCEYLLRLFRHARKLKQMDEAISSGAWNQMINKVGNDLKGQLDGLSGDIDESQLIDLVTSKMRQGQGRGPMTSQDQEGFMKVLQMMGPMGLSLDGGADNVIQKVLQSFSKAGLGDSKNPASKARSPSKGLQLPASELAQGPSSKAGSEAAPKALPVAKKEEPPTAVLPTPSVPTIPDSKNPQ